MKRSGDRALQTMNRERLLAQSSSRRINQMTMMPRVAPTSGRHPAPAPFPSGRSNPCGRGTGKHHHSMKRQMASGSRQTRMLAQLTLTAMA